MNRLIGKLIFKNQYKQMIINILNSIKHASKMSVMSNI